MSPNRPTDHSRSSFSLAIFAVLISAFVMLPAITLEAAKNAPKKKANAKKKPPAKKKKKGITFKNDWRKVAPPLLVASYDGDTRKVSSELRKKGANVNATLKGQFRDADRMKGLIGGNALHFAAWKGQTKTIPLLIRAKVNINARDVHKRTPLHWASLNAHYRACDLLIKAGADINAKDKDGSTPLYLTVDEKTKATLKKAGGIE